MGTLSLLLEWQPFNMTPPGAFNNPQTDETFRNPPPYAEPAHFTFYPGMDARAPNNTRAGVWEINGKEFLAAAPVFPIANTEIVTVPERPVDKGTWMALTQGKYQYAGNNPVAIYPGGYPDRGVYNQPRNITSAHAVAGAAPSAGIYTGFYDEY
jgi:hypothetical protein